MDSHHYPHLLSGGKPLIVNGNPSSQLSQTSHSSIAAAATTNNTNSSKQNSNSSQNRNNSNENLFAVGELIQLTRELIVNLRNCRSRLDQLESITDLGLRSVENGPYAGMKIFFWHANSISRDLHEFYNYLYNNHIDVALL
jgi:hypothetical protein